MRHILTFKRDVPQDRLVTHQLSVLSLLECPFLRKMRAAIYIQGYTTRCLPDRPIVIGTQQVDELLMPARTSCTCGTIHEAESESSPSVRMLHRDIATRFVRWHACAWVSAGVREICRVHRSRLKLGAHAGLPTPLASVQFMPYTTRACLLKGIPKGCRRCSSWRVSKRGLPRPDGQPSMGSFVDPSQNYLQRRSHTAKNVKQKASVTAFV